MSDNDLGKPKISFAKNGPILVKGLGSFKNSRGETIKTSKMMAICRCGASTNKPFCDGSHVAMGFTDDKSADRTVDKLDEYKGKVITVLDNRGICSHAAICTEQLPTVCNENNWLDPDGDDKDRIIEIINKCPSGALSYALDGKVYASNPGDPEMQVSRDGPLEIRGGIEIETDGSDEQIFGAGASTEHYVLCRCGQSKNKPFCDGSHWYAGFKDNEDLTISAANRAGEEADGKWIEVGSADDFKINKPNLLKLGTKQIVLTRTEKGFFAVDAVCPHQGGPLGEGDVCENKIRCPWHGFEFDLESGKGIGNDTSVDIIEVREVGGKIEALGPKAKRSNWTVSHVMIETLVEWGVDTVFGMVGHSNLGVAEAIRVQEQKGNMRFFGVRHEGTAAFACSGYAKVKGTPAACLAIAGPGATNLLTGLWDAKMDRAPVLALTGQVNSQVLGPGAFQEIDTAAAFAAVSKFSQTVLSDSNHAELAALACKNAIVERDVAHLILPDEIQVLEAGDVGPGRPEGRVSATTITPPEKSLNLSVHRISSSTRPLIIVGYGASLVMQEVIALAEKLNCPIITTFKAKGLISDEHELGGGVLGKSGIPVASTLMAGSDLLIVFGSSFSQHTGIATNQPIIQVDYDRMTLGKFHAVDEAVWGEIGITAKLMRERIPEKISCLDQRENLKNLWASWREEKDNRAKIDNQTGVNSASIFKELSPIVPDNAVISVDVGNNTYSFGRYFECKANQKVIMSGYLGSIGFGFPAGMGAWAAVEGNRKVVVIAGDGGFGQYLADFTTAVKYKMDITLVLLHNKELGKISKEQRDGEWEVWQTSLVNPGFAEFARLCGGDGITVKKSSELKSAFEAGINSKKPFIVEIISDALLT